MAAVLISGPLDPQSLCWDRSHRPINLRHRARETYGLPQFPFPRYSLPDPLEHLPAPWCICVDHQALQESQEALQARMQCLYNASQITWKLKQSLADCRKRLSILSFLILRDCFRPNVVSFHTERHTTFKMVTNPTVCVSLCAVAARRHAGRRRRRPHPSSLGELSQIKIEPFTLLCSKHRVRGKFSLVACFAASCEALWFDRFLGIA